MAQVCLEGEISKASVMASLARGQRAAGDLIPWTIAQQFQDDEFARLSGARVVRIATHPDMQRMGYGSRALTLLKQYYQGEFELLASPGKKKKKKHGRPEAASAEPGEGLLHERCPMPHPPDGLHQHHPPQPPPLNPTVATARLAPTSSPRELLSKLSERPPEKLHWLGTSYGVTPALYNYWKRAGYSPVYLRLTANELTGEHTCIMLATLSSHECDEGWLPALHQDFKHRFIPLLGYDFRTFPISLALDILAPRITGQDGKDSTDLLGATELGQHLSPYDMRRLESYASQLVDYHMILDMVPVLAKFYFLNRTNVAVSFSQASILLALTLTVTLIGLLLPGRDPPRIGFATPGDHGARWSLGGAEAEPGPRALQ